MSATQRVADAGIKFKVGQTVTIDSYPRDIEHVLKDGEYVVLNGDDLSLEDVAENWETAETLSVELGDDHSGYVLVKVTKSGQQVMQHWRDIAADCWELQN